MFFMSHSLPYNYYLASTIQSGGRLRWFIVSGCPADDYRA